MMKRGNAVERNYRNVAAMSPSQLAAALVEVRLRHYMANPDMIKDVLVEMLSKDVAKASKSELIDELYNEGYWA